MLNSRDSSRLRPDSKIKIMSQQYRRFCVHQKNNQSSKYACIINFFNKFTKNSQKIWNTIMPIFVRGTVTPYQSLIEKISACKMEKLDLELPFSKNTVIQDLQETNKSVLLVYDELNLSQFLQSIKQNQSIGNLTKSSIPTIPISIQDEEYVQHYKKKVAELFQIKQQRQTQLFFVVLWKGLFNEIIALDAYSVENQSSYLNIIEVVEKREELQAEIKKLAALQENVTMIQQSSTTQINEKANITRASSFSSL